MFQMITAKSSKIELMRAFNQLTVSKIVSDDFPRVGELSRAYGNEVVEQCIAVLVADLSESFNGDLTKDNIDEIAVEINTGILRNHSLESIYLALKRTKTQDIYGKLTVNKVLKELHKTFDEISDAVMLKNYNNHLALKHHEPRPTATEQRKQQSELLSIAKTALEIEKTLKK